MLRRSAGSDLEKRCVKGLKVSEGCRDPVTGYGVVRPWSGALRRVDFYRNFVY